VSKREPRPRASPPPQAIAPRAAPTRPQRHVDPIFSRPYEPDATSPAPLPLQPASAPSRQRQRERPVAALLGGLKRATG